MIIRTMTAGDLADVVQAECESPAWTAVQFEAELNHPFAWQLVVCMPGSFAFAGYLCWRTVEDESEIMKFAVVPCVVRALPMLCSWLL